MSRTGNDVRPAAATHSDSQCHSSHDAPGHQPKGTADLQKQC